MTIPAWTAIFRDLPAIRGLRVCVTGCPLPIGAFTKSRKSASGWQAYRLAALQVSITEPPPTATYASKCPRFAKSMASLKLRAGVEGWPRSFGLTDTGGVRERWRWRRWPGIRGLHPHSVIAPESDAVFGQWVQHRREGREARHSPVRHQTHIPRSQIP